MPHNSLLQSAVMTEQPSHSTTASPQHSSIAVYLEVFEGNFVNLKTSDKCGFHMGNEARLG